MRALPAGIQTALGFRLTSFVICWTITARNGTILRGTEHDRDIEIATGTHAGLYLAQFNISGSDVKSSSDLAVDNLEVAGATEQIFGATFRVEDIESGILDGAAVIVFLVDWTNPNGGQVIPKAGYIGSISRDSDRRYRAEIRGLTQKLSQQIGQNYSENCNVVRFGDARCKFDVASITQSCTIVSVENRKRFTAEVTGSGPPLPTVLPRGGEVTWTSGGNAGFTREVKLMTLDSSSAFVIELYEESAADMLVGDLVTVVPGCDRLASTCRFVYDNLVNFRGHGIFIPGTLAIMRGNLVGAECVVPTLEDPAGTGGGTPT